MCLLVLLNGCAGLNSILPAKMGNLSEQEVALVGAEVEARLLQILGGQYMDEELSTTLDALAKKAGTVISVADRSSAESYPLPGQRVVLTRGLLTRLESLEQLRALLKTSSLQSRSAIYRFNNRTMVNAARQLISTGVSSYDPESPGITIAKAFAGSPCDLECNQRMVDSVTNKTALPASIAKLKGLQEGLNLLAEARQQEKSGNLRDALALYLDAAIASPDQAVILRNLGMAYLRSGDYQSARLHLQKAEKLQPDYYKTEMGLGFLYLKTDRQERAKTALTKSVEHLPVTENLFLLAEVMEKTGDAATARELYQFVTKHDRYSKLGRTATSRLRLLKGR